MLPTLAASASCGERFMREAEAMAAVEHDHVVRIYQIDEERGIPFMAMEFLKGEPLDERLKRDEQIPLDEILRIGREIAEGLAAAHKTGLIHRDIKPGNIWLEERDGKSRVKILDFGLARAASQEAGLTQQGAIIGTPAYMAPEQGRGAEVDPRCDLFSLGVVLYRLCTGNQPFHGPDTVSTLMAVAMHDPVVPIKVNQELLPELSDLVMKLLEKDPADRVATAGEVVKAIQAMERKQAVEKIAAEKTDAITAGPPRSHGTAGKRSSQDSAPAPTQTVALPRRRSMALLVVGVLGVFGVLALLGGGIFYWQTNNGTVRIEVNDPDIQVSFDKKDLIFKGVDKQDLRVSPGEYGLHVKRGDLEFDTDKPIVIKRGDAITLKIEWHKDGKLQVAEAGKVLGEKAVPAVVVANAPRFKNDLGMEFALVPKGKAWLGGSNGKEGPNEVNIPQDFYLDVYEVTQEEWQKVMGMDKNPSAFSRGGASRAWVNNIADDELKRFPVENVWWDQAKEFVKLVNEKVNKDAREAGWEYRLPTEQQWEYACRGGPMTDKAESAFDFYFDKPSKTLAKDQANFEGSGLKRTRQVGSYAPNRLGLYDMHGNVREWCENGTDPKKGWLRATRGGGWESDPGSCASAYRPDGTPHDAHWGGLGLRLARVPVAKTDETPIGPPAAVSIVHTVEGHPGAVTSRRRARGRRKCRRRRSCSCCPANT
jgi:formylglycine-generating enzyme required for sulfatase activity